MPDFALPVTSELSLPWVHGANVVCLFAFLFFHVACSVSKSLCFRSNGNIFFCRPQHQDYDMVISLIIMIMSYTSVALGRSDVSFLAAICFYFIFLFSFCGCIAFVLRSTAIPAVRIPVCTLYSKLTCNYRNFDVSVICIVLIQQSTGIVIRGMTPALSLHCKFSWRLPNDSCTTSLRICTLLHDQPKSVG